MHHLFNTSTIFNYFSTGNILIDTILFGILSTFLSTLLSKINSAISEVDYLKYIPFKRKYNEIVINTSEGGNWIYADIIAKFIDEKIDKIVFYNKIGLMTSLDSTNLTLASNSKCSYKFNGTTIYLEKQCTILKDKTITTYVISANCDRYLLKEFIEEMDKSFKISPPRPTFQTRYSTNKGGIITNINNNSTFDTIVLNNEVKTKLKNDLSKFLSEKKEYENKGVPWKRGYLLYGPPGTGKTSLIRAIQYFTKYSIIEIDLKKVKSIEDLRWCLSVPNTIYLFEDFDAQKIDLLHNRTDKNATKDEYKNCGIGIDIDSGGVSLSDLLNCLDGITYPYGSICIFTSNFPDNLDPALTRPGRIDLKIELGKSSLQEIQLAYKLVLDKEISISDLSPEFDKKFTVAEICNQLKEYGELRSN